VFQPTFNIIPLQKKATKIQKASAIFLLTHLAAKPIKTEKKQVENKFFCL